MTYTSHPYAMFVEGAPLDDIRFQAIVYLGHELEGESLRNVVSISLRMMQDASTYLENGRGGYAMRE